MQKLFRVLADSLVIGSRNFTLLYVLLLAPLLFGWLLEPVGLPRPDVYWLAFAIALLLVLAALMAGWYAMVAEACVRFLAKPREQALREVSPVAAFTLFQSFFPGVARFFPAVAGGVLLHAAFLAGLGVVLQRLWSAQGPLMEKLLSLDLPARQAAIQQLSIPQQVGVGELAFALLFALLLNLGFSLVFMLWPAFVVFYGDSPLKAYWRSLTHYFRHPVGMLGLAGWFILVGGLFSLLNVLAEVSGWLLIQVAAQLGSLLLMAFMAIATLTFVYHTVGKPTVSLAAPPAPQPQSPDA